ncbi:hypothetical protein F2Q69_00035411 [Brassica cretica]|uniref:Uncharacterized protein n=1 Tax=Brassica cretica TaxID=69181 RepID=A0A8S9SFX7_BRACR|nr:hypothetical protein F2Q69_00035411 [Brassica cretica]
METAKRKREIISNLSIAYIRDETPNFNRPSVLKESRKKEEAFRISSPLDCLPRFSRSNRFLKMVNTRKLKGEKTPTTEEDDRDTNLAAANENINPVDSVEEEEEDENCVDTRDIMGELKALDMKVTALEEKYVDAKNNMEALDILLAALEAYTTNPMREGAAGYRTAIHETGGEEASSLTDHHRKQRRL